MVVSAFCVVLLALSVSRQTSVLLVRVVIISFRMLARAVFTTVKLVQMLVPVSPATLDTTSMVQIRKGRAGMRGLWGELL